MYCISTLARHADSWTGLKLFYHPIILSCKKSWLILCDNGCVVLQRLGIAKLALLFAMLGAKAVGS